MTKQTNCAELLSLSIFRGGGVYLVMNAAVYYIHVHVYIAAQKKYRPFAFWKGLGIDIKQTTR